MIAVHYDGAEIEIQNFATTADFKASDSVDRFASQIIVEGGNVAQLVAVAKWAGSLADNQNTILVLDSANIAGPYAAQNPFVFIEAIREQWDGVNTSGAEFMVQEVQDIVDLVDAS